MNFRDHIRSTCAAFVRCCCCCWYDVQIMLPHFGSYSIVYFSYLFIPWPFLSLCPSLSFPLFLHVCTTTYFLADSFTAIHLHATLYYIKPKRSISVKRRKRVERRRQRAAKGQLAKMASFLTSIPLYFFVDLYWCAYSFSFYTFLVAVVVVVAIISANATILPLLLKFNSNRWYFPLSFLRSS